MMNNKGFAITGILYTLFILFVLTLFAILSGLNTRDKLMKKSIESYDDEFLYYEFNYGYDYKADYDGFYVFKDSIDNKICTTYMKKGTNFEDAIFIEDECSNYKDTYVLREYYKSKYWR